MDYLILIYDFFVGGWPTAKQPPAKIQPETKPPAFEKSDAIYWNFEFDNPRFILYEDQFDYKKSNVLILFTKLISFKLTSSDEKMDFYSSFFDFMIKLRSNKANKYGKPLKYTVLSPTTFNFFGVIFDSKRPENKDKIHEHYNVVLHDIYLNMTPLMLNISLKMWTSIMNSFDKRFNPVAVEKRVVSRVQDEGLFKPVPFKADDFWFTQKKSSEEASIRSSGLSEEQSESPQRELVAKPEPIHTKSELTIEASKIFVKLEVEQMPLIKLNMSINNGKYGDWYGSPSLSLKIDLDFTYFNEEENVWEPVIEPMESNGVLKPYQVVFDMKTNSESILKMRERDDNLPIRTFFIFSKMPLEFVVTRKFISLLETIQRNYVIDEDKNRTIEEDDDYNLADASFRVEEASKEEEEEDLRIEEEDEVELDESYSSFNFLVKNELGQDVFLESICGFNVCFVLFFILKSKFYKSFLF
jgi:hypothetical protein